MYNRIHCTLAQSSMSVSQPCPDDMMNITIRKTAMNLFSWLQLKNMATEGELKRTSLRSVCWKVSKFGWTTYPNFYCFLCHYKIVVILYVYMQCCLCVLFKPINLFCGLHSFACNGKLLIYLMHTLCFNVCSSSYPFCRKTSQSGCLTRRSLESFTPISRIRYEVWTSAFMIQARVHNTLGTVRT